MIKGRVLSITVSTLLLLSCSQGDFDYSKYHTMKGQELRYADTLDYTFIPKAEKDYSLYLSVRYTDEYEFSNIWWKVFDKAGSHRVEIPLFDKAGKPLGKCTGGICTQTVIWKKIKPVSQDTLNFKLVQNMRRNPLTNVSEVGLIITEDENQ